MVNQAVVTIDTPASILHTAVGKTKLYIRSPSSFAIGANNTVTFTNGLVISSTLIFEINLEDGDILWAHRGGSATNVFLLIVT